MKDDQLFHRKFRQDQKANVEEVCEKFPETANLLRIQKNLVDQLLKMI